MDKDTFGSIEQYKMLDFLRQKISLMNNKDKRYISTLILRFNSIIKKSESINDILFKSYILDLIHQNFMKKINNNKSKYDEKVISYLKNYIKAKIKNAKIV